MEAHVRFQERLDRLSNNDPTLKWFDVDDDLVLASDEAIRLGTALQNASHVTKVTVRVMSVPSVEACSTLKVFLESSTKLETFRFLGEVHELEGEELELRTQIARTLFFAAQKNPVIQHWEVFFGCWFDLLRTFSESSSSIKSLKIISWEEMQAPGLRVLNEYGSRCLMIFLHSTRNHLESLVLDDYYLDEAGAKLLADILPANRKIVELSLYVTGRSAVGASAIFEALQQNHTLKTLRLKYANVNYLCQRNPSLVFDDSNEFYPALCQFLPLCQLEILEVTRSTGLCDRDGDDYKHQEAALNALMANKTLKEVRVNFLESSWLKQHSLQTFQRVFQPYLDVYLGTGITVQDSSCHTIGKYPSHVSNISRGLWPLLLEAAQKRNRDANWLYNVVSICRIDLFVASE